jgi:hypothetical protein
MTRFAGPQVGWPSQLGLDGDDWFDASTAHSSIGRLPRSQSQVFVGIPSNNARGRGHRQLRGACCGCRAGEISICQGLVPARSGRVWHLDGDASQPY